MSSFATAHLSEIDPRGGWIPVRRHFDVQAFGVNAWTAAAGDDVIPEHDEQPSGHEELYLVLDGRATFTLDGEQLDAPSGTFVFVRDPAVRRSARAEEAGTTILSLGAKPGEAYEPRLWEVNAEIFPLFDAGEFERARGLIHDAMERYPESGVLLYNLACAESRLGEPESAVAHLVRAVELEARFAELAQTDPDLEAIRDQPGFPAAAAAS